MIYNVIPTVTLVVGLIAVAIYRLRFMPQPAGAPPDWKRRNVANTLRFISLTLSIAVAIQLYLHI